MILIDLSQTMYSCFFAMPEEDREEEFLRHVVYTTVLAVKNKFQPKGYGRIVIAADGPGSWRKKVFPQYKARRSKARSDDARDWGEVFRVFDTIADEFKAHFPYKFIRLRDIEADDVIATLVRTHPHEKHLIVSSDKDFKQLHDCGDVTQWDAVNKRFVSGRGFDQLEFIIRGDVGDGVPNVLTDDTALVDGRRQHPITRKRLAELRSLPLSPDSEHYERYLRNAAVMDLRNLPRWVQDLVVDEFNVEREPEGSLFDHFREKGLKRLMEKVQDFREAREVAS